MVEKIALISGARGMDAAHLSHILLSKDYIVYGLSRRSSSPSFWRLEALGIMDQVCHVDGDLTDQESLYRVMTKIKTDHPNSIVEIYNLAANSFVGNSWSQPCVHLNINTVGSCNVMTTALRVFGADGCKIYMAGSSEQFGKVLETPQIETTPFNPRSPYGVSKCAMHYLAKNFRESYGMFICVGILFNHTSELRGDEFVEQKIVRSVVEYYYTEKPFELGNLEAKRDYGHSIDYMVAAHMMLQHTTPDDYVVATGEAHKIEDVLVRALSEVGLDDVCFSTQNGADRWTLSERRIPISGTKLIASCNKAFYRPAEVDLLIGDSTKIRDALGWKPEIDFDSTINGMVKAATERYHRGERLKNV